MSFHKFRKQFLDLDNIEGSQNLLRVINTLQGNIDDALQPLVAKTQNDSQIVTNITLRAGQNNIVNTSLGRKLTGWQVVRLRAQAQVWDDQDNNPSPNLTLWLHTSADVTVDLLIF